MRDYIDLCARLESRANRDTLYSEAAEAIKELKIIADKMTSLGVDLEDQVAEQLQADWYWSGDYPEQGGASIFDAIDENIILSPTLVKRAHNLPDVWVVIFPELNKYSSEDDTWTLEETRKTQMFYSEEEAISAVVSHEEKDADLSEGYKGL